MTVNFAGHVYNDAGSAISGASVKLLETGTTTQEGSTVTTDSNGAWAFTEADQDRYDVEITKGSSVRRIRWDDQISLKEIDVRNNSAAGTPAATFTNLTNNAANQVAVFSGANSTRADGDEIYLSFKLADSAGNLDEFARMTAEATDVTSGSEDGQIRFGVIVAGTLTDVFTINSTTGGAAEISYEVDSFTIKGGEGEAGVLYLFADQGDDAGDEWKVNVADGGVLTIGNDIASAGSYVTMLTITPHATTASSSVAIAGDATVGDDLSLTSDSSVLGFGADTDTTLTHTDGTGLTLNSTNKLTFGDATSFIQQSADGTLRIDGEAIIDLNASTRVDVSGDIKVGGEVQTASIGFTDGDNAITIADGGAVTFPVSIDVTGSAGIILENDETITNSSNGVIAFSGNITVPNAGTIGSAGDTDSIAIASDGVVTMNQIPVFSAGINVSGGTIAGTLATAAQGNVTSLGTLTALTIDDVAVDGKVVTMTGSSSDTAVFTAGTNGTLSIVTTDAAAAAANIQITADGTAELAGTTVTLDSAADIELEATNDINIPANVGLTFGDDAEKIEGDGTDLTIAGNNINLTAVADVVIPANVGITFGSGEKIEGDSTDLTVTSGADINLTATADVNIPSGVGITFGDDAEKIEGDGTDLTISGNNINLTATADVVVPANVGITFGSGEKIEGDSTDLTITSGAKINLTATSDVVIPANVGITFGSGEKIEGDSTDLTITSGADIALAATADVNIPSGVGVTFGDDGEKIEGDGTNLTIASSGVLNIDATGGIVINEDGDVHQDLRVESQLEYQMLFVDAGNNSVTVGGATTAVSAFAVRGDATGTTGRLLENGIGASMTITGDTKMLNDADVAVAAQMSISANGFTGASAITVTDLAALYIAAPPLPQTNITATRRLSLFVDAGSVRLDGSLYVEGTPTEGSAGEQLTSGGAATVMSWSAASSLRENKNVIAEANPQDALATILNTKAYRFHYKEGRGTGDIDTEYVGIMADEAPWAMHYGNSIVNPVNTLGYTVLAVQALSDKIENLESLLAKKG